LPIFIVIVMPLSALGGCLFGSASAAAAKTGDAMAVNVVPRERLFVSEPRPSMFGNDDNPPKGAEGWTNENWLKSRFHFNFAEWSDGPPSFGVLRVMNDDLVQPNRGFGPHPHRDMEIVTFVVEGSLTHKDSMGTSETLGRGSMQFMTAGTGVRHTEHNWDQKRHLRFIQSWVTPRKRGLAPNYGSMVGDGAAEENRKDKWALLVSDVENKGASAPVQVNQDCNVFVTELGSGARSPPLALGRGRQAYMLCVEGDVQMMGDAAALRRHDAARLAGPADVELTAGEAGALVLVFEMASST